MTFAVNTVRRVLSQPKSEINCIAGRQLLRAATSVGANYRARAPSSHAQISSQMTTVLEECDESLQQRLIKRLGAVSQARLAEINAALLISLGLTEGDDELRTTNDE